MEPWRWQYLDTRGEALVLEGEMADKRFSSQGDAETWLGEFFPDLVVHGVSSVSLFEADRLVYGPMSLSA